LIVFKSSIACCSLSALRASLLKLAKRIFVIEFFGKFLLWNDLVIIVNGKVFLFFSPCANKALELLWVEKLHKGYR